MGVVMRTLNDGNFEEGKFPVPKYVVLCYFIGKINERVHADYLI